MQYIQEIKNVTGWGDDTKSMFDKVVYATKYDGPASGTQWQAQCSALNKQEEESSASQRTPRKVSGGGDKIITMSQYQDIISHATCIGSMQDVRFGTLLRWGYATSARANSLMNVRFCDLVFGDFGFKPYNQKGLSPTEVRACHLGFGAMLTHAIVTHMD